MQLFNLKKENICLLSTYLVDDLFYTNNGLICGNTNKELPSTWTMTFNFNMLNHNGKNALIFEFGSYDENNGFGIYVNNQNKLTFRINNNYDNYQKINTTINLSQNYEITIINNQNKIYFYVNGDLKFSTTEKIKPFNKLGAFMRFSTVGSKDENVSGTISNVVIYDKCLTPSKKDYNDKCLTPSKQDYNDKCLTPSKKDYNDITYFPCPNCGNTKKHEERFVKFNQYVKQGEPTTNEVIKYNKCPTCKTIFSPEMMQWTPQDFAKKCYNQHYIKHDRDYVNENANRIIDVKNYILKNFNNNITHLDYGSGMNFLSKHLKNNGYKNTFSYDPFTNNIQQNINRKYDLITAIQVIEHSYNANEIFQLFYSLLNTNGKLIITTYFCDNVQNLNNWWYCKPRVGHILFFTKDGFTKFALKHGFIVNEIKGVKIVMTKK